MLFERRVPGKEKRDESAALPTTVGRNSESWPGRLKSVLVLVLLVLGAVAVFTLTKSSGAHGAQRRISGQREQNLAAQRIATPQPKIAARQPQPQTQPRSKLHSDAQAPEADAQPAGCTASICPRTLPVEREVAFLGLILSKADDSDARAVCRGSWLRLAELPSVQRAGGVAPVFVVGTDSSEQQARLMEEASEFGDLLQVDVKRAHEKERRALALLAALQVLDDSRARFRYLLKTNDRAFVRLDRVVSDVRVLPLHGLLWAALRTSVPVQRSGVWAEPDFTADVYPWIPRADAYVLSADLARIVGSSRAAPAIGAGASTDPSERERESSSSGRESVFRAFAHEDTSMSIWLAPLRVQYVSDGRFFETGTAENPLTEKSLAAVGFGADASFLMYADAAQYLSNAALNARVAELVEDEPAQTTAKPAASVSTGSSGASAKPATTTTAQQPSPEDTALRKLLTPCSAAAELRKAADDAAIALDATAATRTQILFENLVLAKSVLDWLGVPFFLLGGSLLGWSRQCGIVPHTTDVDLGVRARHYSPRIAQAMQQAGFTFTARFGEPDFGLEMSFTRDNHKVDILFAYDAVTDADEGAEPVLWTPLYHPYKKPTHLKQLFWKWDTAVAKSSNNVADDEQAENAQFLWADIDGVPLRVPINAERWLADAYGDWQTPVKAWNWWTDPRNVLKLVELAPGTFKPRDSEA